MMPAVAINAVEQSVNCARAPKEIGHTRKDKSEALLDNANAWDRVFSSRAMSAPKAVIPGLAMEFPRLQTKRGGMSVNMEALLGLTAAMRAAPRQTRPPAGTRNKKFQNSSPLVPVDRGLVVAFGRLPTCFPGHYCCHHCCCCQYDCLLLVCLIWKLPSNNSPTSTLIILFLREVRNIPWHIWR